MGLIFEIGHQKNFLFQKTHKKQVFCDSRIVLPFSIHLKLILRCFLLSLRACLLLMVVWLVPVSFQLLFVDENKCEKNIE